MDIGQTGQHLIIQIEINIDKIMPFLANEWNPIQLRLKLVVNRIEKGMGDEA
jgi:hypothetical protein